MSPESRKENQHSPREIEKRLRNLVQNEPTAQFTIGDAGEGNDVKISQTRVAPWRPKTSEGMRIGKNLVVEYQETDIVIAGNNPKEVNAKVTLACKTRLFGEPKIEAKKLVDGEIISSTPELVADIFTALASVKPKTLTETSTEQEPKSLYQRFDKETQRIIDASREYVDKTSEATYLQMEGMVVKIFHDTEGAKKELGFELTLPPETSLDETHIAKKYYSIQPNQPLKEFTVMQGAEEPTTGVPYTTVSDSEAKAVLSMLESLSTKSIKEQLNNRQTIMNKALTILDSRGEDSYAGDRRFARFEDREPQVSLTEISKGHIQIARELFLSGDGDNTNISIIQDQPIKICKYKADERDPRWIWKPASPDEVVETIKLLDELA